MKAKSLMQKLADCILSIVIISGVSLVAGSFSSCSEKDAPILEMPIVKTTPPASLKYNSVVSGGEVENQEGTIINSRGVCWGQEMHPTVDGLKTSNGTGTGPFSSMIDGLEESTVYFLRAYATNKLGTSYGEEYIFKTPTNVWIGMSYGGGKVAYIFKPTEPGYSIDVSHGIIVAPVNAIQGSAIWGKGIKTGATNWGVASGYVNTNSIVSACGSGNYAAWLCSNLVYNGYDDWVLPSVDEAYVILTNSQSVFGLGFLISMWTSTEHASNTTYAISASINNEEVSLTWSLKSSTRSVLAIRYF